MTHQYCELCDKSITASSKNKHPKSLSHKYFKDSITRRYITSNPNFDETDEKLRKFVNNYNRKYDTNEL